MPKADRKTFKYVIADSYEMGSQNWTDGFTELFPLIETLIPGRSPVDGDTAVDGVITQMDGERWEQIGIDKFPGLVGLNRSQGVTTDGSSWFFSWQLGLEKTDLGQLVLKSLAFKTNKISQGEYYVYLRDMAQKAGIGPSCTGTSSRSPII